jgi:D-glycerate 3-kinase
MAEPQPDWQKAMLERNRLPGNYLASAQKWFNPVAQLIAEHQSGAGRPWVVAVNGSQGSGKSTFCDYLAALFAADYGLSCAVLSLDDFYLTAPQRRQLALEVHPLFATRGVPGTHDMSLLGRTLDALQAGEPVSIPRFDKAADDRVPESDWRVIEKPVHIVLLEGWCMGAMAQPVEEMVDPVNALEAREDSDGRWRDYVNGVLSEKFSPLYRRVDEWIMLQAPSFDCVYHWRLEQEQKLAEQQSGEGIMSAAEIERFIQFYQRLTEHCLSRLPAKVNHLFQLNHQREIQRYVAMPGDRV